MAASSIKDSKANGTGGSAVSDEPLINSPRLNPPLVFRGFIAGELPEGMVDWSRGTAHKISIPQISSPPQSFGAVYID